jgi:hypothetical protein
MGTRREPTYVMMIPPTMPEIASGGGSQPPALAQECDVVAQKREKRAAQARYDAEHDDAHAAGDERGASPHGIVARGRAHAFRKT